MIDVADIRPGMTLLLRRLYSLWRMDPNVVVTEVSNRLSALNAGDVVFVLSIRCGTLFDFKDELHLYVMTSRGLGWLIVNSTVATGMKAVGQEGTSRC